MNSSQYSVSVTFENWAYCMCGIWWL